MRDIFFHIKKKVRESALFSKNPGEKIREIAYEEYIECKGAIMTRNMECQSILDSEIKELKV